MWYLTTQMHLTLNWTKHELQGFFFFSWWYNSFQDIHAESPHLKIEDLSISLSPHDFLPLICSKADHPNIVKLLGNINLKDGKWVIPLEFIFGEDLETTIFKASKSKIQVKFSWQQTKGTWFKVKLILKSHFLLRHSAWIVWLKQT